MNPSLRQMRALVAIAKTGSFTLAAEHLNLTQSALSGQIKELEQLLGVKVVERTTRRAQLSEVGRGLSPLFDKMLQDLDGAMAEIASRKALKKGMVRVAAPQMMSCTMLPAAIAAYRAAHPAVQVPLKTRADTVSTGQSLSRTATAGCAARVFSGEVDFGVGPERDAAADIDARSEERRVGKECRSRW